MSRVCKAEDRTKDKEHAGETYDHFHFINNARVHSDCARIKGWIVYGENESDVCPIRDQIIQTDSYDQPVVMCVRRRCSKVTL